MKKKFLIINVLLWYLILVVSAQVGSVQFDLASLRQTHSEFAAAYDRIKIQPAWELVNSSTPSLSEVIIGIVDTAIQQDHPEFTGVNLGRTPPELFNDPEGHGTSVSGIIGANNLSFAQTLPTDSPEMNGIISGVKGLNYVMGVRTFKVKTLEDLESNLNDLIKTGGAQIINLSLHGVATSSLLDFQRPLGPQLGAMEDADFKKLSHFYQTYVAKQSSTLFVIISGNHNLKSSSSTPGNVSSTNAIIVGATDARDEDITKEKRAIFVTTTREEIVSASNFGDGVDISAPGIGIYAPTNRAQGNFPTSSLKENLYRTDLQGTSVSAPLITGVAAIIKAIRPTSTPAEIKNILTKSADPIFTSDLNEINKKLGSACDPGNRSDFRGCRLNALKAVESLLSPSFEFNLDSLSIDGNIPSIPNCSKIISSTKTLEFFDDFSDNLINTGCTSNFTFSGGVKESNGFLTFSGLNSLPQPDNFFSSRAVFNPLFKDGSGNTEITASFRTDLPDLPPQESRYGIKLFSEALPGEEITLQVQRNDNVVVISFLSPSPFLGLNAAPVSINPQLFQQSPRIFLRIIGDDQRNLVIPSFSLDGRNFQNFFVPNANTITIFQGIFEFGDQGRLLVFGERRGISE